MSAPFVTTVRVRPARGKTLTALAIDRAGRQLVEITVWGRTVAIADVVGPSLVWVDATLGQPASRDQLSAVVASTRALMQTAKDRGLCEHDHAPAAGAPETGPASELLTELKDLGG